MTKEKKLSELCSQWADSVRYQVKPSTYGVYVTMIEKHILPDLGQPGAGTVFAGKAKPGIILEYYEAYRVFGERDPSDGGGLWDRAGRETAVLYS